MSNKEEYRLFISKPKLLEELIYCHKRFCKLMPYFFELENSSPIKVCLNEKDKQMGVFKFEYKPFMIFINPNKLSSFQEALFTTAHESGHYLHFLKRPEFYESTMDTNLKDKSAIESLKIINILFPIRELIADSSSFEFFRREDLLDRFLTKQKQLALEKLKLFGDGLVYCMREPFDVLVHYYVYKKLVDEKRTLEIMTGGYSNFFFNQIGLMIDEGKKYIAKSFNITNLDALPHENEPTFFDQISI